MFAKPRIPIRQVLTEGALPSSIQRRVYRRRGYRIAADVEFAPGAVIDAEDVEIGPGARIGLGAVIRGNKVRIGRRVQIGSFSFLDGGDLAIGDDSVIREQVFVGGPLLPDSRLELGKRVRIFQICFLNPSKPITIGDDTGLGGLSSLFTHASWRPVFEGYPVTFAPITIGRGVWLPWHMLILPGVEIGDGATISAGSVINRSIPARALAAGNPAKVIKEPGEWPKPLGKGEQWRVARTMFAEMLGYLRHQGVTIEHSSADGRDAATLVSGATRRSVALVRGPEHARAGDDILLELFRFDAARERPAGVVWFSLLDRVKGGPSDEVASEVEDWLHRYGLFFASDEEWASSEERALAPGRPRPSLRSRKTSSPAGVRPI